MAKVLTFDEAVTACRRRHDSMSVLLGNGFSIDWDHRRFGYGSLFDQADLAGLSVPKRELFADLDTTDFEVAVEGLLMAGRLGRLYGESNGVAARLLRDAAVVRRGLGDAIAKVHPDTPAALTDDQIRHARSFLSHFQSIFTLNYDLLLYWLVMSDIGSPVPTGDGFGWQSSTDRSHLVWSRRPTAPQRIFYLHGALHLYVRDRRLRKLAYSAGRRVIAQVRDRLGASRYPLLVTEGNDDDKTARIARSAYLRHALHSLGQLDGALFVHGVSLSANDDHIVRQIEEPSCSVSRLYVSLHGVPTSTTNRALIERARTIAEVRGANGGDRLRVRFYDAASAHVWR